MTYKMLLIGCSTFLSATAMAVLKDSIALMIPWLLVMTAVILADLASGVRKSMKLGVRVSPSTAFRETVSKWIVYLAFVLAVCMIDVVANDNIGFAKWACLFVVVIEMGSVVSNLLRPYGIIVTPKNIIKWFLRKTPLGDDADDLTREETIEEARRFENEKWNKKDKKNDKYTKS